MKFLPNVVTSTVGRQILLGQKHSPVIMVATGTVGVVVAGVLACRATLKMDEILREAEDTKVRIAKAKALKTEKYNEDDADRDLKVSRIQLAVSIARAYAPAVIIGAAGIALIAGSHIILSRRYAGVTAAYAAVDKAFKDYRQRVIADVGEEKDREYRYDMVDKEVFVDDEMGGHTETVKVVSENGMSMYAVVFDEASRNWKPEWSYNQMFLAAQQTWANNMLRSRGQVFLNEIYDMLDIPRTKAGAVCGWMDGGDGDDTIIFDVFGPGNRENGKAFTEVNEKSVWIDFNVDGIIYDKI